MCHLSHFTKGAKMYCIAGSLTGLLLAKRCFRAVVDTMEVASSLLGEPRSSVIMSSCSRGVAASKRIRRPSSSAKMHPTDHMSISTP